MKLINPRVEMITPLTEQTGKEMLKHIEQIARTCYKSEDKITDESAERMIRSLIKSGHTAMIEHMSISFKFICSRAASHQIVRHRIAAYAQESQRYCNYSKDKFDNSITFIQPPSLPNDGGRSRITNILLSSLRRSEQDYFDMVEAGAKPQEARLCLPNATKTEVNMTANFRELRAFFMLRCDGHADDEIRCMAKDLLCQVSACIPVVFDDLYLKFILETYDEIYEEYKAREAS